MRNVLHFCFRCVAATPSLPWPKRIYLPLKTSPEKSRISFIKMDICYFIYDSLPSLSELQHLCRDPQLTKIIHHDLAPINLILKQEPLH